MLNADYQNQKSDHVPGNQIQMPEYQKQKPLAEAQADSGKQICRLQIILNVKRAYECTLCGINPGINCRC